MHVAVDLEAAEPLQFNEDVVVDGNEFHHPIHDSLVEMAAWDIRSADFSVSILIKILEATRRMTRIRQPK